MSGVLDQNEEVIDVAYRLSSLSYFLEAVRSLSRLLQSAPPNLPARQKKVITLVEVARRTLLRAGVVLHTFAACPPHLEGHKRAYLELLTHLNAIKPTVTPDALRVRVDRLCLPLFTEFHIERASAAPMPGMASDMSQGSSSQRQALSRDKPLHAAVRHPSARHGTMPAPDAFTGSRICSTDVLGIGPRSQLHAASGDVAAHTVSKQLRSGGRNLSSRAVVMLSEDEDDPWLKEVDASAWLKGPSAADSDDASEADTVRYSHGEESDSGSSDEEDVTPPRYKKGKFGIFASAGRTWGNARGRH